MTNEYFEFLTKVVNEYRKPYRPLSKVIMARKLGFKFNLSPDYCKEIVNKFLKGQIK